MPTDLIQPVILSGGMGTRLWPMSRIHQPKQFQPIDGEDGPSFLQDTVMRHRTPLFRRPLLVGATRERQLIDRQLTEIGVPHRFIGEPVGRNTGPAVLAAALTLAAEDPSALFLVLPSDHRVDGDLNIAVEAARPAAKAGRIVLFGIKPRHPETGFGYITSGDRLPGLGPVRNVTGFVEKPDETRAQALMDAGDSLWSSGISLMRADTLIEEFRRFAPETLDAVRRALDGGRAVAKGRLLDAAAFMDAENQPTETLIFERSRKVAVMASDVEWSDVGAWTAIHSIGAKSKDGNVSTGRVMMLDTHNSLVRAGQKLVTVIGMEDVIIVDTPDALLVTNRASAQRVKEAVMRLKAEDSSEVLSHPHDKNEGVEAHEIAPGGALEIVGGTPAGAILAIAAGAARLVDGPLSGDRDAGEHLGVQPGQVVLVENRGDEPLRVVVVDLCPQGSAGATTITPGRTSARGREQLHA